MKTFDNIERDRYYGLRIGDTIKLLYSHKEKDPIAEVIKYVAGDNNRIQVRLEDGTITDWVAEWCKIITKVEEK